MDKDILPKKQKDWSADYYIAQFAPWTKRELRRRRGLMLKILQQELFVEKNHLSNLDMEDRERAGPEVIEFLADMRRQVSEIQDKNIWFEILNYQVHQAINCGRDWSTDYYVATQYGNVTGYGDTDGTSQLTADLIQALLGLDDKTWKEMDGLSYFMENE